MILPMGYSSEESFWKCAWTRAPHIFAQEQLGELAHAPTVVATRKEEDPTDAEIAVAKDEVIETMKLGQFDPTYSSVVAAACVEVHEILDMKEDLEGSRLYVVDP